MRTCQVAAASAPALRWVSLELGGKSAAVVLDDADPDHVAEGMKVAALINGGQATAASACIALVTFLGAQAKLVEQGRFGQADAVGMGWVTASRPTHSPTEWQYRVTDRSVLMNRSAMVVAKGAGRRRAAWVCPANLRQTLRQGHSASWCTHLARHKSAGRSTSAGPRVAVARNGAEECRPARRPSWASMWAPTGGNRLSGATADTE
ncbi:aldehyde dehydrogenase family protein [Nocardia sp. NPDC057455]|uniref:aldehyde dehydrogenase family protein n=1 Tax=Nocardia sp. NPDC057455 TaxID=3346138 RepID=UPI00366D96A5